MDNATIKKYFEAVYDLDRIDEEFGYTYARTQAKFLSLKIEAILKDNSEPIDDDIYKEGINLLSYLDDFQTAAEIVD